MAEKVADGLAHRQVVVQDIQALPARGIVGARNGGKTGAARAGREKGCRTGGLRDDGVRRTAEGHEGACAVIRKIYRPVLRGPKK